MTWHTRMFGGTVLVIFALSIVFSEITLHVIATLHEKPYKVSVVILLVALVVGFIGMYTLNPLRAKDGGQFLVNNAVRIIQVLRNGRRKDDQVVAVLEDHTGQHATVVLPTLFDDVNDASASAITDELKRRKTDDLHKGAPDEKGD